MHYGSLFSGIGGFDLGLDRAGLSCAWQVEKDPMAAGVLTYHWPDVPVYDDVKTFGVGMAESVDVIAGGFPCQDLSVAGKRAGLSGDRSGLFWEMLRIVDEFQPRVAVFENVPGLLSSCSCRRCRRHCAECGAIAGGDDEFCWDCGSQKLRGRVLQQHRGADFFTVISALGFVGYSGAWTILDAQFFGPPQRRRRLFGVFSRGHSGNVGAVAGQGRELGELVNVHQQILSFPNRLRWDSAPGRTPGADTAGRIAACLNAGGNNGGFRTEPGEHLVAGALHSGHPSRDAGDASNHHMIVGTLSAHSPRHGHAMTTQQAAESGHLIAYPDPAYAVSGNGSKFGSGRDNQDTFAVFDTTQITSSGNYSNPQPGDPCHPLTAGTHPPALAYNWQSGGDVRHNFNEESSPALLVGQVPAVGVRRLTPVECERLQGFPDDWTRRRIQNGQIVEQSDSARYRQLGNAVAVPVAEWIARRIMEVR